MLYYMIFVCSDLSIQLVAGTMHLSHVIGKLSLRCSLRCHQVCMLQAGVTQEAGTNISAVNGPINTILLHKGAGLTHPGNANFLFWVPVRGQKLAVWSNQQKWGISRGKVFTFRRGCRCRSRCKWVLLGQRYTLVT